KHIEIRHHFIRDAYEKKLIYVLKIHTDDNLTDLLTKAFDVSRRWTLEDMMMIWGSLYSFLRATYGVELVSAASLVNTARTKLSTARLVDFLTSSSIHHALTVSPTIYISYIEQFWNTASSQTVNDEKQIHATVDSKAVVVTEASIRSYLLLNDVVAIFSPQWKYLLHTILHCLSSKSTRWNEFSTNIASVVICLATNQKFNFSKLIFNGMLRNLDNPKKKFLMYPRFLMVFLNNQIELGEPFNDVYITLAHTLKVFSNMSRKGVNFSGKVTPLFDSMLVPHQAPESEGSEQPTEPQLTPSHTQPSTEDQPPVIDSSSSHDTTQDSRDSLEGTNGSKGDQVQPSHDSHLLSGPTADRAKGRMTLEELYVLCTNLSNRVLALEASKDAQVAKIIKLKTRIKKLKKKSHPVISHHRAWLRSVFRLSMKRKLGRKEFVSKQGRKNVKPGPTLDDSTFDDLDADHGMDYMDTEEPVNEGRLSKETEDLNVTHDTEVLEKGGSNEEPVSVAGNIGVSTAILEVSTATLMTPPTTTSMFEDEDIFLADALVMLSDKIKLKGVAIKEVKESDRPERSILTLKPLPSIEPKDKGKGVLKESPVKKVKRNDLHAAQIAKDAEVARLVYEGELVELEREKEERQRQEQASVDYIANLYDEEGMDERMIEKKNKKSSGVDEEKVLVCLRKLDSKLEVFNVFQGGDSVERAITTDASLDAAQDSDNIFKTQSMAMLNVDIPQGIYTYGSPRHQDIMGGTPAQTRSDEGRMKLDELITLCTKLSKQVLDLEKEKNAQDVEILNLKKRVKKLERKRKSSISHPRRRKYRQVETASDDDLDEEDASKQERRSDKLNLMFKDKDFEELDDHMENVEEETVDAAATGVSTVSAPVSTAGKAKNKGVGYSDVEDSSRIVRPIRSITTLQPLLNIDPKDKGKGLLVHEEEVSRVGKSKTGKTKAEVILMTALAKKSLMNHFKPELDDNHELSVKDSKHMKSKKLYKKEKRWIDDFQPMDTEAIKDSEKKVDSSSNLAGGDVERKKNTCRKRTGEKKSEESAKKQKLEDITEEQDSAKSDEEVAADYEHEKEELRMWLTVVLDEEETVDPKILSA
ncbi:hypothetical protein Tco_0805576, partial [Tanacetum coccineum]